MVAQCLVPICKMFMVVNDTITDGHITDWLEPNVSMGGRIPHLAIRNTSPVISPKNTKNCSEHSSKLDSFTLKS